MITLTRLAQFIGQEKLFKKKKKKTLRGMQQSPPLEDVTRLIKGVVAAPYELEK